MRRLRASHKEDVRPPDVTPAGMCAPENVTPDVTPDVTPARCMDCGMVIPAGDNTCESCYRDPQPAHAFPHGYYIARCTEPKRRPASVLN